MLNYKRNAYTPKTQYIATEALKALREIQEQSVLNGTSEMTLEEINAEIAEARREMETSEETKNFRRIFGEIAREAKLSGRRLTFEDYQKASAEARRAK